MVTNISFHMAKIGQHPINNRERPKRSEAGIELVRLLSSEGDRIFSIQRARELSSRIGLKEPYLVEALYHLRQTGWIVLLRRGLYAISTSAPGAPPTHEFEIAMALVTPAAISHWPALHYHGLTEQPSGKVFVTTTTETSVPRRGNARAQSHDGYLVGNIRYQFIQTKPERFFGTTQVWVGEARITITDPERTLIDRLSMPQYCGDFAEALHAFDARGAKLDLDRIVDYALRLDATIAKRLGWVLEHHGPVSSPLERLPPGRDQGIREARPYRSTQGTPQLQVDDSGESGGNLK
jgi:predicted transcriptional regulator of viral defense system